MAVNVLLMVGVFLGLMSWSEWQSTNGFPDVDHAAIPRTASGSGGEKLGRGLVPRTEDQQTTTHQVAAGGMATVAYLGTALGVGGAEVAGLVGATGLLAESGLPLLQRFVVNPTRWLAGTGGIRSRSKVRSAPAPHGSKVKGAGAPHGGKAHGAAAPLLKGAGNNLRNTLEHMPTPSIDSMILAWEILSYFRRCMSPEQHEAPAEMPAARAAFPDSVFNLSLPAAIVCAAIIMMASFGIGIAIAVSVVLISRSVSTVVPCAPPQPSYQVVHHPLSSLQYFPKDGRCTEEPLTPRTVSTAAPSAKKGSSAPGPAKVPAAW